MKERNSNKNMKRQRHLAHSEPAPYPAGPLVDCTAAKRISQQTRVLLTPGGTLASFATWSAENPQRWAQWTIELALQRPPTPVLAVRQPDGPAVCASQMGIGRVNRGDRHDHERRKNRRHRGKRQFLTSDDSDTGQVVTRRAADGSYVTRCRCLTICDGSLQS